MNIGQEYILLSIVTLFLIIGLAVILENYENKKIMKNKLAKIRKQKYFNSAIECELIRRGVN